MRKEEKHDAKRKCVKAKQGIQIIRYVRVLKVRPGEVGYLHTDRFRFLKSPGSFHLYFLRGLKINIKKRKRARPKNIATARKVFIVHM